MNKKGFMRKKSFHFMAFVLLLTVIMASFNFIGAAASGIPEENVGPKEYNDIFSNIKVSKWGSDVAEGSDIEMAQWNNLKIEADFTLPNNTVKANDISRISIPASMFIMQITEIKDAEGNVVAKVSTNNRNRTGEDNTKEKELIITYTDYVEKRSEVKGKFFFEIRVDHTIELEERNIPILLQLGNSVTYSLNLKYKGFGTPEKRLFDKSGWYVDDKTKTDLEKQKASTLEYRLQVNQTGNTIKNAKIVDKLVTEKVFIRPETLKIKKGKWKTIMGSFQLRTGEKLDNMSVDVTEEFNVVFDEENRGFTIDMGNIEAEEGYEITYYVETEYLAVNGEIFNNDATLTGEGVEPVEKKTKIMYAVGGGVAEGSNYKIKIIKKDEADQTKRLKDAKFDVIRERNGVVVGRFTTGEDGTVEVGNLLKDTYIIKETEAPEGYELGTEEIKVDPAEFHVDTKIVEKIVTNKEVIPYRDVILPESSTEDSKEEVPTEETAVEVLEEAVVETVTEPVKIMANNIPEVVEEKDEEIKKIEFATAEMKIPESPEENDEVEEEDLDLFGDEIPRGDTDIQGQNVKPAKTKAMLAKTGGLKTYFVPVAIASVLCLLLFIGIEVYRKKNNRR